MAHQRKRFFFKLIFIGLGAVYLLYVCGVMVFLNTSLFAKVAGFQDDSLTQVRFRGAYSLFPGHLSSREIEIAIRDQNVIVDTHLDGVTVRFRADRLFYKELLIRTLHAKSAFVKTLIKTEEKKAEHFAQHGNTRDLLIKTSAEKTGMSAQRWDIQVDRVELPNIRRIEGFGGKLTGNISIFGGFHLQPGVVAEVFPSIFTVSDGSWNDEVHDLQLQSKVQIHAWPIEEVAGNKVFQFMDAEVDARAKADSLRILDVILRSLPNYRFGPGNANLSAHIRVKRGFLLPGTRVNATDSAISFLTPAFEFRGRGSMGWEVPLDSKSTSVARLLINGVRATIIVSDQVKLKGTIHQAKAQAHLQGLFLPSAFSGLSGTLSIVNGTLKGASPGEEGWSVRAKMEGSLSVLSGDWPDEGSTEPVAFHISLPELRKSIRGFATLTGDADIQLRASPIDFRRGFASFPELLLRYSGKLNDHSPFGLEVASHAVSRQFYPGDEPPDRWKGALAVKITGFDQILTFLSDSKKVSKVVAGLLSCKEVNSLIEGELSSDWVWLRASTVKTDGLWSAWGTWTSDSERGAQGQFEGRVLGLPVGLKTNEGGVKVSLIPSVQWYDTPLVK